MTNKPRLQVFPDISCVRWRWRIVRGSKITASSGESFATQYNSVRALLSFMKSIKLITKCDNEPRSLTLEVMKNNHNISTKGIVAWKTRSI